MRYVHLQKFLFSAAVFVLLALPQPSFAIVDCDAIQKIVNKESFKAITPDLRECIQRGWPVPPGWVPDGGKGMGLTSGGAGGYSYGAVRAPESPPGSRNEDASVSAAAITGSCNFPPRIKLGLPPTITFPAGSCLDFLNGLFKDNAGNTASSAPPVGVLPTDTCPADSNNAGIYGVKNPAVGSIPAPCGGMVPIATADLTLNANPTDLATTTAGVYSIWTYRKGGAGFAPRLVNVALPTYLCGAATDSWGKPIKTVDLTAPTEQMITYKAGDPYIAVRLKRRDTMPATYYPPYLPTDPERFLVLPLNAAGDPIVPGNCALDTTYWKPVTAKQDILVQSALDSGADCAAIVPTMVNYPTCGSVPAPPASYSAPGCGPFKSPKNNFIAICNPSVPPPPWAAKILPVAGVCAADISASGCTVTPAATDANCDVVSMPVTTPTCPDMQQYMALNRPSLFYPSGTTASFLPITGRTQVMSPTVAGSRFYMQTNTLVTVQNSAPPLLMTEGGSLTQNDKNILIMNAPATLDPASGVVTMPNGGQLTTPGGALVTAFSPGASYSVPGGQPYILHVGRSFSLPTGYMLPTVPTIGAQPPYMQMPVALPVP